jgi:hypothetical protein
MFRPDVFVVVSLIVPAMLVSGVARADDAPPRRLHAGQIVVDDLIGFRFGTANVPVLNGAGTAPFGLFGFTHSEGTVTQPTGAGLPPTLLQNRQDVFTFAPSLDVLVTDHVSLGGALVLQNFHARIGGEGGAFSSQTDVFSVALQPRVGYLVRLGDDLSLWPRAGFGLAYAQQGDASQDHATGLSVALDVPLVLRAGSYVAFMFGPEVGYTKSDDHLTAGATVPGETFSSWRAAVYTSVGLVL